MYFELKDYDMMNRALDEFSRFLKENGVSEDCIFTGKLVSCELVSNVFQHSDGIAFFRAEITDGRIVIKVKSTVKFCPPDKSTCSDVYAESGRGLYLIDCLSESRTCKEDGTVCVTIRTSEKV